MSETSNAEDEDIGYTNGEFITNSERSHVQALLIQTSVLQRLAPTTGHWHRPAADRGHRV